MDIKSLHHVAYRCKDAKQTVEFYTKVLNLEYAMALAEEGSPCFVPGAFQIVRSVLLDEPKIREAFKTGRGVGWHEHNANVFVGTERFFRPGYAANLIASWIPALEGVEAKLQAGAKVADVGCGLGRLTRAAAHGGRSIDSLVAQVEMHLQGHPDDGRGWEVIAPVYLRLGRADDAVAARRNALRLNGETAEREAALAMVADRPGNHRITLGADKAYDVAEFVGDLREYNVTPHVAQNTTNRRSAIDGRTTRHPGYAVSGRMRKRIEEVFGWTKGAAGFRKTHHRGLARVGWMFTLTATAYNLIRLPKLATIAACVGKAVLLIETFSIVEPEQRSNPTPAAP